MTFLLRHAKVVSFVASPARGSEIVAGRGVLLSRHARTRRFASVAAKASDPQSGTRKFNAAKSSYSLGPAAESITLTLVAEENNNKIHSEGIDGEGKATKVDFTAKLDGKDSPATRSPA